MIFIPGFGWLYRATGNVLVGPFPTIGDALKSSNVAKAREFKRNAISWRSMIDADYRNLEFNPQSDLINDVYEKDIAFAMLNASDEDLPF
jgi:hypothetical protein